MNREIKFKQALHFKGKFSCWHYWGQVGEGHFISPANPNDPSYQFTGLKDKNGIEIYEGDILLTNGVDGKLYWRVDYEVDTGGSIASFEPNCINNDNVSSVHNQVIEEGEVIGNVVENPKLN